MGLGMRDEENPVSEDEAEAERQKLRPDPEEGMEMKKIPVKTRDAAYPEVIPGHSDPLCKPHHLKYLLFGFNFLVTILGIAILAISIWIRVDPEFWEYESTLKVDNFNSVCVMFIVTAIIMLIIGFLGCFGAASERRWMLILYIVIFGIIFLIELAALVLMWRAPYSKTISDELQKQLRVQIKERRTDDSSRYFMDFIQDHLECCGAESSADYDEEAPHSCQDKATGTIYPVGCATKMLTYLREKAGIVGGIALPILLLQLLALVASGCLIRSLEVESRYFM